MKIIIIGGGIAGCSTAIKLAQQGHTVTILEEKEELLLGTSNVTACRLGLGFHYRDIDTAIKYLRSSIGFIKTYPNFKLIDSNKGSEHLNKVIYYITKDSQVSEKEVLELFENLKNEYKRLIALDASNEVVGPYEFFYKIIPLASYQNQVNLSNVVAAIETVEGILDWEKLRAHLLKEIKFWSKHITVNTNSEVFNVNYSSEDLGFVILAKNKKAQHNFEKYSEIVINCSWHNIEFINNQMGFINPIRTNRTKAMVEVALPDELHLTPSKFFCFGPHCSFTNIGHGKGLITYEPVTNIESNTDIQLSETSARLLAGHATQAEKEGYSVEIIKGVAKYIPAMIKATCIDIRFGIVKTLGQADINDPESEIHKRRDSGVNVQQIGWIDNACMKLLYFPNNAIIIKDLVDKHSFIIKQIKLILEKINSSTAAQNNNKDTINKVIGQSLQRVFTEFLIIKGVPLDNAVNNMLKGIESKTETNKLILTRFRKEEEEVPSIPSIETPHKLI
ncbi:MAG: glycerol-3-phosphate dehydrogenase [Francisellaceae bacterium]|nr:glycerol-3-phosphate dehydrogenase [Francisellaceae bacterium]